MRRLPRTASVGLLEDELENEVHVPRTTLRDHWIAGSNVRRFGNGSEVSGVDRRTLSIGYGPARVKRVVWEVVEVPAVEDVEYLPPDLDIQSLSDFGLFHQRHVPLGEARPDDLISARVAHGAAARGVEGRQR